MSTGKDCRLKILVISMLILMVSVEVINSSNIDIDNDNSAIINESIKRLMKNKLQSLSVVVEDKFIPKMNLSVNEYIDGSLTNFFNASIQSINRTHWIVKCDSTKAYDINNDPIPLSFTSSVNRTSNVNHIYETDIFYNWFSGLKQGSFDFWIDVSDFFEGYSFTSEGVTFSVSSETIKMKEIGEDFSAWKLQGENPSIGTINIWYEKTSGLFLSMNFAFISEFWYNLTYIEQASIPEGYTGPIIIPSLANNSVRPSGTTLELSVVCEYTLDVVYFQWDDGDNTSSTMIVIQTSLPSSPGEHILKIMAIDSIGLMKNYRFVYTVDNSLANIFLNYKNGSYLKGGTLLNATVVSGNGSIIYNWNNTSNVTIAETDPLPVPTEEGSYQLTIFIRSISFIWVKYNFVFIVDNTLPIITFDNNFKNKTVVQNEWKANITFSEPVAITYSLNNQSEYQDTIVASNKTYQLTFSDLDNGTYYLLIKVNDKANNSVQVVVVFYVHASTFGWNYSVASKEILSMDVIDVNKELLFKITIVSNIDQSFSLQELDPAVVPISTVVFVVEFSCEFPDGLVFITLSYPVDELTTVHKWVIYNDTSDKWDDLVTVYNPLTKTWEAVIEGSVSIFALIDTGETTTLESITPGGAEVPSFDFIITIIGLMIFLSAKIRKKMKKLNKK